MSVPPVPDSFFWTTESWGPALRCRPLDSIAAHFFTTRKLELSRPEGWQRLTDALGAGRTVTTTQVHGNTVVTIKSCSEIPASRPEADVLITDQPDLAIAVRAADCVPLLLADSMTGAVGAVHAGWRGTAAGVATAAVQAMIGEFGTRPADIVAAIGPAIGVCCYEVGSELVDAFAAAGYSRDLVDRWFLAVPPSPGGRRYAPLRLNISGANRDQLVLAGVRTENIHCSGLCTAMHLDVLTSYRAEREKAGRIAAAIKARAR
jgi:hypothetical protein